MVSVQGAWFPQSVLLPRDSRGGWSLLPRPQLVRKWGQGRLFTGVRSDALRSNLVEGSCWQVTIRYSAFRKVWRLCSNRVEMHTGTSVSASVEVLLGVFL